MAEAPLGKDERSRERADYIIRELANGHNPLTPEMTSVYRDAASVVGKGINEKMRDSDARGVVALRQLVTDMNQHDIQQVSEALAKFESSNNKA